MARVVIGAGWGDEGKGATVDRLVRGTDDIVVRFNGGAQAGHTVVAPDGRRHIFHHVGSGTFHGAATYLSQHVVSSPMHLEEELDALRAIDVAPCLFADPRGLLTTPYDMLLNQAAELARGGTRHGSCGYGFGETIERAARGQATTLADLDDLAGLRTRLLTIRDAWVPARFVALGVGEPPAAYRRLLKDDDLLDAYLEAAAGFREVVTLAGPRMLAGRDLVFEGAQGLALDQERGAFPHVTRSYTGLRNALEVAAEIGLKRLDVSYVTRCYATRHGAGPLPGATPEPPVARFRDDTNVANGWQGSLRFAPLDLDSLHARIATDFGDAAATGIAVTRSLAVTCLDQADAVPYRHGGKHDVVSADRFASLVLARLRLKRGTAAFGPERFDSRDEFPDASRRRAQALVSSDREPASAQRRSPERRDADGHGA